MNIRDHALQLVDDGFVDEREMLVAALKFMSSDDVAEMLVVNGFEPEDMDADYE